MIPEGTEYQDSRATTAEQQQAVAVLNELASEQAKEIGLSPAILGDMRSGSYRSAEAAVRAARTLTIIPILEKIERAVEMRLLEPGQELVYDTRELLRGDPLVEAQIATMLRTAAIFSRNQALEAVGKDPTDNPADDEVDKLGGQSSGMENQTPSDRPPEDEPQGPE